MDDDSLQCARFSAFTTFTPTRIRALYLVCFIESETASLRHRHLSLWCALCSGLLPTALVGTALGVAAAYGSEQGDPLAARKPVNKVYKRLKGEARVRLLLCRRRDGHLSMTSMC